MPEDKDKDQQQADDMTKGQTLAEMEKEVGDGKKKEVVFDSEEPDGNTLDHEVVHSDNLTADVDVKRVTNSQRRLWMLVILAVSILAAGGFFFYSQLEDGNGISIANGDGSVNQTDEVIDGNVDDTDTDNKPKAMFAYAIKAGSSDVQKINISDMSEGTFDANAKVAADTSLNAFQISSDGTVSATRTGAGIVLVNGEAENTVLAESSAAITSWVLTIDGVSVFAVVSSDLYKFSTTTGEGGVVAENFTPTGTELSNLYFARDGSIAQYAKTEKMLYGSIYKIDTEEIITVEKEVVRLDRISDFSHNSLSPDGTSLLFIAEINDNQTLQLLSLNSFVLRTVFVAEDPGTYPQSFAWSQDSNNVAVEIAGASPRLAEIKIGTLQKEYILDTAGGFANLSYSPDKDYVSYVQNGKLRAVELDSHKVVDLFDGLSSGDTTGWFVN